MIIRRRISAAEFVRMDKAGVFAPGERLELLDGEIHTMSPIGPRHAFYVDLLVELLSKNLPTRWRIRSQNPISLGPNDLPQPDIAIIRALDWSQQHPGAGDIALVVEVADSSREFDLGEKRLYYATRGIAAAPCNDGNDLLHDKVLAGVTLARDARGGLVKGLPYRLDGAGISIERAAPDLGQHTKEVLRGLLGYDDAKMNLLAEAGVTSTTPSIGEV